MIGNEINNLLQRYGYGESQKNSSVQYLATVCTTPISPNITTTKVRRRNLQTIKFWWNGLGGCVTVMCGKDNKDGRLLSRNLQSSWFFDTYKYTLESEIARAISTEIVNRYVSCFGVNPKVTVTIKGITLSSIQATKCNSSFGFLDSASLTTQIIPKTSSSYGSCTKLDFAKSGSGTTLVNGAYVSREWKTKHGITITASGTNGTGYTPSNMARIFDTRFPTGDPDLGSPNSKCPFPGPGIGVGGEPGKIGSNCIPVGSKYIPLCVCRLSNMCSVTYSSDVRHF
jgi:hypothetical protein